MSKLKKRVLIAVTSVVAVLAIALIGCAVYVGDYYRADVAAIDTYVKDSTVEETLVDGDMLVYSVEGAKTGFIFYPGGKVEYTAYEPLMRELASNGIMCVLIKMPFNLAVFDSDAAKGVQERYPDIDKWYIGGHSLGGSMAADYVANCEESYEGIVLLGAYSTTDVSETGAEVLSIYGSEDKVLNHKKYEECKSNLPDGYKEEVIEGGCHAYFGMYGPQDGDGVPTLSNKEQIRQTANIIMEFTK